MEDYKIEHEENTSEGSFFVEEGGNRIAELEYIKRGNNININHTGVDDSLQGKGVGKALVMAAVDWARTSGIKITPSCSYARALFKKDTTLHDVLG